MRASAPAWAWLPVPLLLTAALLAFELGSGPVRDPLLLLLILNFCITTLSALFVADLLGRTFAIRGEPGTLFLMAGMVVWGTGGLVSSAASTNPNVGVTVHNTCAFLSAACVFTGVVLSSARARRLRGVGIWSTVAYLSALVAVAAVSLLAHEGWMPVFFVQGVGGTVLRQSVLAAACALFLMAALLLRAAAGRDASAFARWYAPALVLLAVGLFGAMVQSSVGSVIGWVGRAAQYLGAVYMVVAAVGGVRESRAWGATVELALRDTERRYDALFTTSLDAILLSDADGTVLAANPAACALFGRSEQELGRIGRAGLLAPGADLEALLRERQRTGGARTEVELVRADGSRFHAELSSVVFDRRGRTFDIIRDMTERKRAEEALREADRRKDHFLAVLSHELRNPLTPLRNGVQILKRVEPGGERARTAQAVIERQVNQLAHLVDDLLDVTRISRSMVQLQRRRLELGELVRRTADDHRALFQDRGIRLQVELPPGPVHVDGDAHRLAQVVGNLLLNAAKYSSRGGTTRVSMAQVPSSSRVALRVVDDGVGMAPEILARLFQPFAQADETLDRSEGGLGLGLALVKGLVELHGGTVSARSDGPGAGAELEVVLPLAAGPEVEAEPPPHAAPHGGRRILVIEDNVDAAETLRQVLELQGHQVVGVAASGAEGVARARESRPDFVLCDIGLPTMDGYAVARAFRADPQLRGTHLVALSGYAQPEDLRRAADAGFEGHMAKPPDLDELERMLARLGAA